MTSFLWKIGGEAGFGIMTTGLMFSKIAARNGYHVFDYVEYPSLIRGGHNTYDVHVSSNPVGATKELIDILVCLNKDTYEFHKNRLADHALVIYDADEFTPEGGGVKLAVPFKAILTELAGQQIMKNTIAIGASLAAMGSDLTELSLLLEQQFGRKGQEVVDFNKRFAEKGYDYVKKTYLLEIKPLLTKNDGESKLVLTGSEAFSLGAAIADCRMYVAYPMTPSSGVLTTLAAWQSRTGMVVRHAEDEISVINTALGATFAGVRSAVGSSGGGFALMVEALSYAGIAELPIVVYLAQRPGPATGMPTWTEQGDLLFTVHAGHGEFPKIVLAPGDVTEMVTMTAAAFDLADIYQTPVIVATDMLLAESHGTMPKALLDSFTSGYKPDKGKTVTKADAPYKRYANSPDGISPRLIPGAPGIFYQANSYEHLEDSHTTEDANERIKQADKRRRKIVTYLKNHFKGPVVYGDSARAETVFVSWGSTKGAVEDARRILADKGHDTAHIHFTYLYPLDKKIILPLFDAKKKYVLVENNADGQFGKLLAAETGLTFADSIFRYDGRAVSVEQLVAHVAG